MIYLLIFILLCGGQLVEADDENIATIDLASQEWSFAEEGSEKFLPAKVPGTVQTDLLTNGKIPDPFKRLNELELQWIGERNWIYKTSFKVPEGFLAKNKIEMNFAGLDTFADVYLNGKLILKADNFFREWSVDCKSSLKPGDNELKIFFKSSLKVIEELKEKSDPKYFDDYVYVRKPAYHFGWDWGPVFVTSGVWGGIELKAWDKAVITDVHYQQNKITNEKAELEVVFQVEASEKQTAKIEVTESRSGIKEVIKVELKKGNNKVSVPLKIDNPHLWWPHTMGKPNLYSFTADLKNEAGEALDSKSTRVGLRTIKLVQKPDELGKSFHFEVNGIPVFMKGANYIPQDMFVTRPQREDYERTLNDTLKANMNMLRVWGGGFYEYDLFYDLCDEKGILVWQDFMYACSMYPGTPEFLENAKKEAEEAVVRLRNHPSIALWCGNNENYIGWQDWKWKDNFPKDKVDQVWKDYEELFHQILADVVKENDSEKYYWPSSPKYGWGYPVNTDGDAHYWGIWHAQEPFENLQKEEFIPRFMSEYGFQGCPEINSVKRFTSEEDLDINSEVMLLHQKHRIGYPVIDKYMKWYFNWPKDFESYLYCSQLLQAYGIGMGIETHRRSMPHCMGTLYWQINDCYPVTSWSSIDVYGKWKALHYAAKKLYREILVSPVVEGDSLAVYVVSDKLEATSASLKLTLLDFDGNRLWQAESEIEIKANNSSVYSTIPLSSLTANGVKEKMVLQAELSDGKNVLAENKFYFVKPKDLILEKSDIDVSAEKCESGYSLTLRSDKLVKNLFLYLKDINQGHFSENYFDLLPGVPHTIEFETGDKGLDILKELVMRSLVDSY